MNKYVNYIYVTYFLVAAQKYHVYLSKLMSDIVSKLTICQLLTYINRQYC